jgi:hypothetical protein
MVVCEAMAAALAGHVVRRDDPIARSEAADRGSSLDDDARDLVAQDERGLRLAIPLHEVRAAHAARLDAYDELGRTGLRTRSLFDAEIVVAVVDGGAHYFRAAR